MDTLSNKGKPERRQAEKGDKASGRRAHHPTKGNKKIKKEDELGEKLDDKMGNKPGRLAGRQAGRRPGDKLANKL